MKLRITYFYFLACLLLTLAACATKPASNPAADNNTEKDDKIIMLTGTNDGLFTVSSSGNLTPLWTGGSVKKILPPQQNESSASAQQPWITLGSEGILISYDQKNWEPRNQGLPVKTIKVFEDGKKSFLQIVQDLKDLEVNPANPQVMVTATKDRVYLSRNGGQSWTDLPVLPYRSNGIKAVAAANIPVNMFSSGSALGGSDLTVFASHSIYGIHYYQPDKPNAKWIEMVDGLEKLETTNNPDEVADIAIVLNHDSENAPPDIFVSQTFRSRLYKYDWDKKSFNIVWSDTTPFGTVDSLAAKKSELYFLTEGTVSSINFSDNKIHKQTDIESSIRKISSQTKPNTAVIIEKNIALHELWLLDTIVPGKPVPPPVRITENKEGLFLPMHHAINKDHLKTYYDVFDRSGLNMIVIDMKDEFGKLRFTPNNPAIRKMATISQPLDLEAFLKDMKERGIFVVARIVVFKDQELFAKENGKYAVWDTKNSKPWIGTGFNERWIDPYSEEVWEFVAMICEELYERGIDEIQFDYVRFPTDGSNLSDARYRWHDPGMDMESAIYSFLNHIRSRVKAPISIDLYGANCWYRTGARTGQEVELLAPLVDVICPMYYPSHFEQYFLAQNPPELRPWRIYYHGALRTDRIARGQVVVRPWAQAFYLNVSYDRKYYNVDYVRRQIEGVREAGNGGFTYWNMSGRYEDIPDK